ncbi:uncharacterized protein PV09_01106 [Verruconis gallopava]|uniref:Mitochondrial genome maintenance protein MGM101 n=1 Tax=Verruconis gallopava TaxID=253628 RepID=A0A0D2ANS0_9PEZI|nr:uncharacterized protein PV09_01106 [Verruconis gallopava]KIW08175.1 hypothetical protein PV09_01106 [Verruconis gallopava]
MNTSVPLRSFIGTFRASSPRRVNLAPRNAIDLINGARYLSGSSRACVNLTRPTSRTATTAAKPAASEPAAVAPKATPPTEPNSFSSSAISPANHRSLSSGLNDLPPPSGEPLPDANPISSSGNPVDWSRSFHGLSSVPFSEKASEALMAPLSPDDVEIKPDGIIYLPEIKYRRILNKAFGPGGWGLAPRGETIVTGKSVTREYGLVVHGRLVSIARGEQQYFDPEGIPTATEGCKSNALMRCCKDLGIASELWDPVFIRKFKAQYSKEVWVEHITSKRKKKIFMRKDVDVPPSGFKFS